MATNSRSSRAYPVNNSRQTTQQGKIARRVSHLGHAIGGLGGRPGKPKTWYTRPGVNPAPFLQGPCGYGGPSFAGSRPNINDFGVRLGVDPKPSVKVPNRKVSVDGKPPRAPTLKKGREGRKTGLEAKEINHK